MTDARSELDLPTAEVAALLRTHFGHKPLCLTRLDSELSTVIRVDVESGTLVAKAARFSPAEFALTQWRVDAIEHLRRLGLPVAGGIPDREGRLVTAVDTAEGTVILYLSEWRPGTPLAANTPTSNLLLDVGRTAALVATGLAGWSAPPAPVAHLWELTRTASTLGQALGAVTDRVTRRLVEDAAERFRSYVGPVLELLPRSVVHHDLHDSNLLVDPLIGRVTGVLDFGDMVVGPRVAELAVAAAYASRGAADPVNGFLTVAEGWGRCVPLSDVEIDTVFDAGLSRLAVNAAVWASRENSDRGEYARTRSEKSKPALIALLDADRADVQAELRVRLA